MSHPHLPGEGRRLPLTTYRLQLTPDFGFDQARAVVPYLDRLGVTDVYLAPILQAAPGSTHGYDVVDHRHVSRDLGGEDAFKSLADAVHARHMGLVVDVVPNHMAVPTPVWHNRAMWSILKRGARSAYANWFDVSMDSPILMPVLGNRIGQVLADQELQVKQMVIPTEPERGKQWVLTYYDHVFPVAEDTEHLPLSVLVERQHYRLAHWQVADEELNYRRFFDVGTLAAVRVEDPQVFAATHAKLLELFRGGYIDAFRVDHPDGLANPRDYFRQLAEATGHAWIGAEKILEGDEQLSADWPVAGTTGYDTAWRVTQAQVDPAGALPLGALMQQLTGDSPASYHRLVEESKAQIIDTSLAAEVRRLGQLVWQLCQDDVRLRDYTFRSMVDCIRQLVIEMPCYRAYVVPGEPAPAASRNLIEESAARALERLTPAHADTMELITALVLGDEVGSAGLDTSDERRSEVAVRFQQVCGAVQAKGVEDTAFYRWTHLLALTEVGGNPDSFGIRPDQLHAFAAQTQELWPATMTCASTHDTKRCEDVRARLVVLSQYPHLWAATLTQLHAVTEEIRPAELPGRAENLLWQTLAGTWTIHGGPIAAERLVGYLRKAVREQKTWTTWTAPDQQGEDQLFEFTRRVLTYQPVVDIMNQWLTATGPARRAAILTSKAVQMTLPGVADIYQGSELTQTSLVDPDNRRPVDFAARQRLLDGLADGHNPVDVDEAKLALTAAIANLRRRHREAFVSDHATYTPLPTSTGLVLAFARGDASGPRAVTVATRLAGTLAHAGGWAAHTVVLPAGTWRDIVLGEEFSGGEVALAELLADTPVVVLERVDD